MIAFCAKAELKIAANAAGHSRAIKTKTTKTTKTT